jgi:hypothetical protein
MHPVKLFPFNGPQTHQRSRYINSLQLLNHFLKLRAKHIHSGPPEVAQGSALLATTSRPSAIPCHAEVSGSAELMGKTISLLAFDAGISSVAQTYT